jgi:branched-chain amino acid transport system ATP-binding protein
MGIARTFQNLRIFPELTAFENVMIGSTSVRLASRTKRDEAIQLLGQLGLGDMVRTRTGDLPYGYQRRVEIARALAARPSLLCLDEPAAGLNDNETAELQEILRQVHMEFNCSIILIDHDMTLVLGLAHRVIVLDEGHVIYEGAPEKVFHQQNVVDAYLGST